MLIDEKSFVSAYEIHSLYLIGDKIHSITFDK